MIKRNKQFFAVVICGLFLASIFMFIFIPTTADNTNSSFIEESNKMESIEYEDISEIEESSEELETDEDSTQSDEFIEMDESIEIEESSNSSDDVSIADTESDEEESELERFPQGIEQPDVEPEIITDLDIVIYNSESTGHNLIDGRLYIEDIVYYLNKYAPEGMFISAASAMAYTEGGAGKTGVYVYTNNCFGIRAYSSWDGYVYSRTTGKVYKDYETAMKYGAKDNFRAYKCMEDSVKDYVRLISGDYYNNALNTATPAEYIDYILQQGYGEYELYGMWMYLIDLYDLEQYDIITDSTVSE